MGTSLGRSCGEAAFLWELPWGAAAANAHANIPELLFDIVGGRSFFDIRLIRLLMMQSSILPSRPGLPRTLWLCGTNFLQMVSKEVYQYIPSSSVYPNIRRKLYGCKAGGLLRLVPRQGSEGIRIASQKTFQWQRCYRSLT